MSVQPLLSDVSAVPEEHRRQAGMERVSRLRAPEDMDVPVWRYMDLAKFVSMLDSSELFFCRADRFEDPYEGSSPLGNIVAREKHLDDIGFPSGEGSREAEEVMNRLRQTPAELQKSLRKHTFINCWHVNETESAAMWKLYSESPFAVAVKSTYSSLREQLPTGLDEHGNHDDELHVDLALVSYIDYETEKIPEGYTFDAFLYKRKSFEHERELRAFFQTPIQPGSGRAAFLTHDRGGNLLSVQSQGLDDEYVLDPPNEAGRSLSVDLGRLVHAVLVAPGAPAWFVKAVQAVCEKFGLAASVSQSQLDKDPVF